MHDEVGCGRPSVSDETVMKFEELMLVDRCMTMRKIAEQIDDTSKTTMN